MKTSQNNTFLKGRFSALLFGAALALCAASAQAAETLPDGDTEVGNAPVSDYIIFRATANGTGDGSSWDSPMSWTNALAAAAADEHSRVEIWLSGDVTLDAEPSTLTFAKEMVIRGGFAGSENVPDERAAGAKSTFDGQAAYTVMTIVNEAGAPVVLEGIRIFNGTRGLIKTGGGDLSILNC